MSNFTTSTTNKGKLLVIHENYQYIKDKERTSTTYFKCVDYNIDCGGRGLIRSNDPTHFICTKTHSHFKPIEQIQRRETVRQLQNQVKTNEYMPLRQAYDQVMSVRLEELRDVPSGINTVSLPQFEEVRGTLESIRRKQRPPLPNTFSEITQKGLVSEFNEGDEVVRYVVQLLAALPLARIEDIDNGYKLALNEHKSHESPVTKDKLNQLLTYFDRTWRKNTSKFGPSLWNRFNILGPRTNNHIEGWHSSLNKKIGSAHPNIFKFIDIIKKEQVRNELKVLHANQGNTRVRKDGRRQRIEIKVQ